jgi:hypothetical protein
MIDSEPDNRKPDDRYWGDADNDHLAEVYQESDDSIIVCVGRARFVDAKGEPVELKSWRVGGDLWCVGRATEWDGNISKSVPVSPPRLYAYCISGGADLTMMKLDLGTGQLTSPVNVPLDRYLDPAQFNRLIGLVRPKFPDIDLPLGASATVWVGPATQIT